MLKNLSIKFKMLILALITIFIVSFSIAIESIYSINELSNKNIAEYSESAYAKKEKELKQYVYLAMRTLESYHKRTSIEKIKTEVEEHLLEETGFLMSILNSEYNKLKDTLSEDALKYRLKSIINATRYGKNGYFWVNDTNAVIVTHPIKPKLNGKDLSKFSDKNGKKIFSEFARVGREQGSGFVDYVWPKPGEEEPTLKLSYVKLFKPYGWVIGTGEYVDDVTSKIQKEAKKTIANMKYSKNGYFWINNSNHEIIMHPIKTQNVGKNLKNLQDPDGNYVYQDIVKIANAKAEGGLVKFKWEKPSDGLIHKKFAYVQRFEPWDWIICTGAYVDEIESELKLMKEHANEEINKVIRNILIFSLLAVIIAYFIYSFLIKKTIITPLKNLDDAINNISSNNSASEIKKQSNDEIGTVVDSFNNYISKLKTGYEEDAKVIEEVDDVIEKVNRGFYMYEVTKTSSNPQVMKLRDSINSMIQKTNENLITLNDKLIEYGNSNFVVKDKNSHNKDVQGILSSIVASTNLVGSSVSDFLSMIVQSGQKLNSNTNVLSESANSLSSSANKQAASLEETAAAIEEITSIVKSNVQNVTKMSHLASDLNKSSKEGESLASKTTKAMDEIDTQVKSINEAITVIDQIAFQTNILSLNAAVEAATAGEAGKGFAVVAQEVRNLASRSAEAAREIKDIVESATAKANEGKVIASDMIGGYSSLNEKIDETITLIENVTQASIEEEKGIIQINDAINELDQATQVNASSATTISNLATDVSSLSDDLLQIADKATFEKVDEESIKDIDLVFDISKVKSDHIKFKNDNFNKLKTTKVAWDVTKSTECNLGNWIIEQEKKGKEFTKTSNWKTLKQEHEVVHSSVQSFVNESCKDEPNNEALKEYSYNLDHAKIGVFSCLNQVKIDNVIEDSSKDTKIEISNTQDIKIDSFPTSEVENSFTSDTSSFDTPSKNTFTTQNKVITSNTNDDEWESF